MDLINKEFVPYKESLDLKELEFDEPCFGFFVMAGDGAKENFIHTYFPRQEIGCCLAPTFSQAFRWFREKYNLHGIIAPRFYNDGSLWYVSEEIDISKNDIESLNSSLFRGIFEMNKTYEEAELACLRKLIEIAKQK